MSIDVEYVIEESTKAINNSNKCMSYYKSFAEEVLSRTDDQYLKEFARECLSFHDKTSKVNFEIGEGIGDVCDTKTPRPNIKKSGNKSWVDEIVELLF